MRVWKKEGEGRVFDRLFSFSFGFCFFSFLGGMDDTFDVGHDGCLDTYKRKRQKGRRMGGEDGEREARWIRGGMKVVAMAPYIAECW